MDIIKTYGNLIKEKIEKPESALKLIKFGLSMENLRVNKFPEKDLPEAFQYLNQICLKFILDPLKNPDNSAWVNLFAPSELLHAFNIYPLSIEAMASFLSGLMCEDTFIDYAEEKGIAETLCSYHKAFIGISESKVLPKPKFALTTTSICDANTNTFRYLSAKQGIPYFIIDVPYEYSKCSEEYVVKQLKEAILMMENLLDKKLDMDLLKEIIQRENETTLYRKDYIKNIGKKYFKTTLTLEMYMLFTTHMFMGTEETLEFFKRLSKEVQNSEGKKGLSIFWVHLIPFYHDILKGYFNLNPKYQLLGCDLNFDYLEEMDYTKPLNSLARKIILNHGNGYYTRKIDSLINIFKDLNPDAVINFCHWGCKQSSGGVMLLKEEMMKRGIPFLSIDGDGVDRRNSHSGQIQTRLEAFLEMIEKNN